MRLKTHIAGKAYEFKDLRDLFARANEEKSGDALLGIGARSVSERIAARIVLSEVTLGEIRSNPLIEDEVTRVIDAQINESIFNEIKGWTVGYFREWLLAHSTTPEMARRVSRGLNSEMIAATAKLMTAMDLVYGARKLRVWATCATCVGLPGTLSYRIQPNHPADDAAGLLASIREGFSYASGDACIGINPVEDNADNTKMLLETSWDFMQKWKIPTQNVVLSHVTTQMEAVRQGAPACMFFQSVAGTQSTNEAFGVSEAILDEAFELITKYGVAKGPNLMYFETGQGSEQSLELNEGIDMLTLEARTYGYAKKFNPFMVNNVSGFIGPETLYDGRQIIRASLEDHFMGKLTGLPMGMAPCYTNHTKIEQDDQEMATMLLALAGSNYYMGVPLGDDVMLAYQDTSYHDDATLRELLNLKPAPEFFRWAVEMGVLDEDGKLTERAGDASIFI
ncbi:MAG: ethanolamine ammonia-lyase subunit EutB [Synergistaceae bacterium]|jgi:ethanolamine ammonia-lyase large subunit|nr:ethanolamine ammonia-lyase subunit EutB [Synergistaceae bacterium]